MQKPKDISRLGPRKRHILRAKYSSTILVFQLVLIATPKNEATVENVEGLTDKKCCLHIHVLFLIAFLALY